MAKQQQQTVKKDSNKVTKQFPTGDRPTAAKTKTVDSLKKLGYQGDPSSVHRVGNNTSITFVKPKKK